MPTQHDKWTACFLSLALPGAGQLWARHWSAVPWLAAAGVLVVSCASLVDAAGQSGVLAQFALLLLAGVASAEHARRLFDPAGPRGSLPWRQTAGSKSHVACRSRGRKIDLHIELLLDQDVQELWHRVADLPRFLTIDPFHVQVTLMRNEPAAGVDLVLWHNALGCRFRRFGKILYWREGRGYAFSDLSGSDPQQGFPHVFFVSVEATDNRASRLSIDVRGRWTSHRLPAWWGRLWVAAICREHARLLRKAL